MATIEYGSLTNANVTIDEAGAIWLWVKAGSQHAGLNLSKISDPSIEEVSGTVGETAGPAAAKLITV
jgi:hypothetical protein